MGFMRFLAVLALGGSLAACGAVDVPSRNATLAPLGSIAPAIAPMPSDNSPHWVTAGGW
jgi:hypothetical protein